MNSQNPFSMYCDGVLLFNEIIYIDTASLMEPSLKLFLDQNYQKMKESMIKIVIPIEVRMELIRLYGSSNPNKAAKAREAHQMICDYSDVFEIEAGHVSDEDVYHAFADRALISRLNSNMGNARQLLITNDRKLATDAVHLNYQLSSRGRRVRACYLDMEGKLRYCSNKTESDQGQENHVLEETEPTDNTPDKPTELPPDPIQEEAKTASGSSNDGLWLGVSLVGAFSIGLTVGKVLL